MFDRLKQAIGLTSRSRETLSQAEIDALLADPAALWQKFAQGAEVGKTPTEVLRGLGFDEVQSIVALDNFSALYPGEADTFRRQAVMSRAQPIRAVRDTRRSGKVAGHHG